MARRTAIRDLPFEHNTKPRLGFELLRLAELFARDARGELPEPLAVPQRPEFHSVYIGTRGQGTLVVDFTPVPLGAGRATIVARGRVEQFVPARGLDAWVLVFSPEFVPGDLRVLAPAWSRPTIALAQPDWREVAELCEQLGAEQARPLDALQPPLMAALLRAVLLRLERCASAETDPQPADLQRFFTILERDCLTTRSVAHYARAAGISQRRLGELLALHAGRSTKQVIDERVVLEQKRLLAHTDITVKQLAERTGFAEPTNLVKFFRHHTGTTPLGFRKNLPSSRRS